MTPLHEVQHVRYPPFEAGRWLPQALPLTERRRYLGDFATKKDALELLKTLHPPFELGTRDGWFVETSYVYGEETLETKTTGNVTEEAPFVDLINHQRRGWYLIPNPIHHVVRQFINTVVLVLLAALFYLFISPLLIFFGLPVYGLETVRWGLLDYPALAVFVVPLLFAPLVIRVVANLVELQRQNRFLRSDPPRPEIKLSDPVIANEPLGLTVSFNDFPEDWNHVDVLWRVGVLPPSREELLKELNRLPERQPPPGLSTELPHHWIVGLDDGTAGGEDAPMQMQEVKGGLFLRPMRIMATSEQQRWNDGEEVLLQPPKGPWPGSVNTDLVRVHWECILRIDRSKGGALLWVEPLKVAHADVASVLPALPLHDGRSELDIS